MNTSSDATNTISEDESLEIQTSGLERRLSLATARRDWSSGFLALLAIVLLFLELYIGPLLRYAPSPLFVPEVFDNFARRIGFDSTTLLLWLVTLLFCLVLWYFVAEVPILRLRQQLKEQEYEIQRSRTATPHGRLLYLQEALRLLTIKMARVFLDNPKRSALAGHWRSRADHILEQFEEFSNSPSAPSGIARPDLGEAQTYVNQIQELIFREESELRAQRLWAFFAVGIIIFYIFLLVGSVLYSEIFKLDKPIPILGVPFSVILWGAAGSLAAILYRFYTARGRIRIDLEVRWLIARPIIGIIMAGVAYLAVVTGLSVLGIGSSSNAQAASPGRMEVYWIVAFLAGFSDKFYLKIIDLLVKDLGGSKDEPTPPAHQKKPKNEQVRLPVEDEQEPNGSETEQQSSSRGPHDPRPPTPPDER
jgi:hypothetical protein